MPFPTESPVPDSPHNPAQSEAMIAGTLCLMSCYVQHPVARYAERVTGNLTRLAAFAGLSPELRTVCRRLSERWEAIFQEAQQRAEHNETVPDARAFH